MQSHVVLQLGSATIDSVSVSRLPDFCSRAIQHALARHITLPEGQILMQSFSSYLTHIELYEYTLNSDILIPYARTEPAIFMLLMLEGHSSLLRSTESLLSGNEGGSFYMGYANRGDFKARIKAGRNSLLLLTIRPEWLLSRAKRFVEFKPLADHFMEAQKLYFPLPDCRISAAVQKQVQKLFLHNGAGGNDLESTIELVLNQLIRQYHDLLSAGSYTSDAWNRIKAQEIAAYIHLHYAEKIEDNLALAARFNVSERQFLRLANMAFNMPLHRYLLHLRMGVALLKLIICTKQPVYEIAAEVGYQDPFYFSKVFTKCYKFSPKAVQRYFFSDDELTGKKPPEA